MSAHRPFRALKPGDEIALVSPASFPTAESVEWTAQQVTSWGLRPRIGDHALDQVGFLAGSDEHRLADVNAAIGDPQISAIVTLLGGCGSHRLVHGVDVETLRADPTTYAQTTGPTRLSGRSSRG